MNSKRIFEGQVWHILALIVLLGAIWMLWTTEGLLNGELWGISTASWLVIALAEPIVHQVFVWLVWRTELESQWLTTHFPKYGFQVYSVLFMLMLLGRPLTILLLSIANRGTLMIAPYILYTLASLLAIPFVYLVYSLIRYFGLKRALGADHFYAEYRNMPLVKEGIFRYTDNGMYIFGFFILWVIPLLLASKAGLIAALFNHLYIWVHFYVTEKPDMERIYGRN